MFELCPSVAVIDGP